jgi:hypothetical protein
MIDNTSSIEKTLLLIKQPLEHDVSLQSISKLDQQYSKPINVSCWSPRSRSDDKNYQRFTALKSEELCHALIFQI